MNIHSFQETKLHDYDQIRSFQGKILGESQMGNARCMPPRQATIPEVITQLAELIMVGGKLTEELSAKLSPIISPRPADDAAGNLKADASDCCPLAAQLWGLREMAQANIEKLQYLLREVQL